MDKEHELAGRVDALLSKHGRTGENTDERNVPLLTDLVEAPAWKPLAADPPTPSHTALVAPTLLKQLSEQEIDALVAAIHKTRRLLC